MHRGVGGKVNSIPIQKTHESQGSSARVEGIGHYEGATATKRPKFIYDAAERVESEHDPSGQRCILELSHAWSRTLVFWPPSRASVSIIASRIANFWTFPVTVDGKLSTNRMYRGIL